MESTALAQEILGRSLRGYRFLRWLIRIATEVFFRRIEIGGDDNVPREGAVIFCGNHPNSLLDPILITAYCGRVVHFAAKDVLFANPVMRVLMRVAGAVPVRRRQDHGGPVDNTEMFETMYAVLAAGRATGIFPEGVSHDRSELSPLKTGAARMAFGVKGKHPDTRVYLIPTGLVYFDRNRFRSNVLIQFGAPIEIDEPRMELQARDGEGAVRDLTELIDARLRALTINAEDWQQVWVLDGVRRLYQPEGATLEDRARVARRFHLAYPLVKDRPEVRRLYSRVERFLVRKSALGIDDATLRRDASPLDLVLAIVRHVVLLAFHLPLFLIGAPVHVPLGLLLKLAGRHLAPRSDVVATTKFLGGVLSVIAVYAALTILAGWRYGGWAALVTAVVLPSSGWSAVRVFGRAYALRHVVMTGLRRATFRREIAALRHERKELVAEVVAMVDTYRNLADEAEAELAAES